MMWLVQGRLEVRTGGWSGEFKLAEAGVAEVV